VAPNFICKLTKSHQSISLGAAKVRSTLAKGKAMIGVLYQYHVWGIDNRGGGETKSTFRPTENMQHNHDATKEKQRDVTSVVCDEATCPNTFCVRQLVTHLVELLSSLVWALYLLSIFRFNESSSNRDYS
jgi:hypothetical protein